MGGVLSRLFVAALLSAMGFAGTYYWYNSFEDSFAEDGSGPIAYLQTGKDKIERRPGQRLIWNLVNKGDPLYNGDAVRTSSIASGEVLLIKSKTLIGLEPDSLIVLEDSKGEISLDLLNGGLFVKKKAATKKGEKETKAPVIKAGKTKLSLGGKDAEMNLSVDKSGKASVVVTKGEVEVKSGTKKIKIKEGKAGNISDKGIVEEKMITVTSPAANSVINIGSGKGSVPFRWKKIGANYKVYLETGPNRNALKRLTWATGTGSSGRINAKLPASTFFWRLVAIKNGTTKVAMKSIAQRVETIALVPPELISPAAGEKVYLATKKISVPLVWTAPSHINRITLVVSRTKDFKKLILNKKLTGSQFTLGLSKPGNYYWKVLGYWEGDKKPIGSRTKVFTVEKLKALEPPKLLSPENKYLTSISRLKGKGLFLQWDDAPSADSYELKLKKSGSKKTLIKKNVIGTQFRLKELPKGKFTWTVKTISADKRTSKFAKSRSITVKEAVSIAWRGKLDNPHLYGTKSPSVPLSWEKGPKSAKKWRVRFAKTKAGLDSARWKELATTKTLLSLPSDGTFHFQVQALTSKGYIEGISPIKTHKIKKTPALPAPSFVNIPGPSIKAKNDGSILIKWAAVKGASKYVVNIEGVDSSMSKTKERKGTKLKLSGLKPGRYKVSLGTYNDKKKLGPLGPSKIIVVPNISNIKAPTVGKIKIN